MNRIRLGLMAIMMAAFFMVSGQGVPNGDFEVWTATGNYQEPDSWSTPNPTTASLGLYTVTRESTLKQSGSYSARLQTRSLFGLQIPGLLTLGTFSINLITMEAKIEGGIPFTWRPESMTGYLQYEPKFGDECFIGVLIMRQNGTGWDTLGNGSYTSTSTLTAWTQFTIPIDYTSSATPTHLNIIILSSDRDNPQPNSTLFIDNLQFNYPVNVAGALPEEISPVVVFQSGRLVIEDAGTGASTLPVSIYETDGRLVWKGEAHRQGDQYFTPALPPLSPGIRVVYIATEGKWNRGVRLFTGGAR